MLSPLPSLSFFSPFLFKRTLCSPLSLFRDLEARGPGPPTRVLGQGQRTAPVATVALPLLACLSALSSGQSPGSSSGPSLHLTRGQPQVLRLHLPWVPFLGPSFDSAYTLMMSARVSNPDLRPECRAPPGVSCRPRLDVLQTPASACSPPRRPLPGPASALWAVALPAPGLLPEASPVALLISLSSSTSGATLKVRPSPAAPSRAPHGATKRPWRFLKLPSLPSAPSPMLLYDKEYHWPLSLVPG